MIKAGAGQKVDLIDVPLIEGSGERCIADEVRDLETKLALPIGFYDRLLQEDDWSFVIKLSTLAEAACSDALAASFHAPNLAACFSTLEMGHKKHGKVALLRALGTIEKEQANALQVLYELRNKLAHNVSQVTFSFKVYLDSIAQTDRAAFIKHVGHGVQPFVKGVPRDSFVEGNPKLALWLTFSEVLACLHLEHKAAAVKLSMLAIQQLSTFDASIK
jgi:hypothetical protein